MAILTPFFDSFPKVQYDINRAQYPTYETVTNIFLRFGYLKDILTNASAYILYEVEEEDTPEIVAEKVYGDAGAGWMILYANRIVDPQFDWPLNPKSFEKFVAAKYGSVEIAKTTYHHYEKVVETTVGDETTTRRYIVNKERLTLNDMNVPYNYYTFFNPYSDYSADSTVHKVDSTLMTVDHNPFDLDDGSLAQSTYDPEEVNGKTVYINTYGNAVTNYDYEQSLNDERRTIKVIKAQFYEQIQREFKTITKSFPSFIRTFV